MITHPRRFKFPIDGATRCHNDVHELLEQVKTTIGDSVKCLDYEGAQATIENSYSFTDLRIYYQTSENVTRREGMFGTRLELTFKDKSDLLKRLRDNLLAFKGKSMRFAPHVGEEAHSKRTAAGKMYSVLRSYNVNDTGINIEYKRTVDFSCSMNWTGAPLQVFLLYYQ